MEFDFNQLPGQNLHVLYYTEVVIPLVTIITPYYNAGEYFENTFNCVINQTFPWFEWIIIDDGSTNPHDIASLKDFVSRDSRIKYFRKNNGGIASARNLAIQYSTTEYIIPLDADDLISPVYLEINYWALHFHPDAAWSYTDSYGFGLQNYLWKKKFSSELMRVNNILTCTAMIRKSALLEVECYSQLGKNFNEDWHTWLKLMSNNHFPLHLSGYHFGYRRTDKGVLSHIRSNIQEQRRSQKFIRDAAKNVKNTITAVEYPVVSTINRYIPPKVSEWDLTKKATEFPTLLLILPWMEVGGADSFNLTFIKYASKYFNIGIVTTNFSQNIWRQRFEAVCDEIYSLPEFLEVKDYAEFISYYIKSRQVKLILISNSYYGYYMIPWLKITFPYLCITDYVHMEELYWRNGGFARNSGIFDSFLEHTYVCNSSTRNVMIQKFNKSPNRISTRYIGVDTDHYNPSMIPKGQIRNKYNLGNQKVILFPCRIDPQKRPLMMVEIIAQLRKKIPDIAVLVAGDGPEHSKVLQVIREKGLEKNIIMTGIQKDLRPFYADSDLTLICSIKEGLSLTSYESLAMGTPVISADVGGQSDLIDDSVGFLIPTEQSEKDFDIASYSSSEIQEYVSKIMQLLEDTATYKEKCQKCRERIENVFSQHKLMNSFVEELLSLSERHDFSDLSAVLHDYSPFIADSLTIYSEIENYVNSYNYGLNRNQKQELMRIVNSKLGQRLIKLALKLHINKLFS